MSNLGKQASGTADSTFDALPPSLSTTLLGLAQRAADPRPLTLGETLDQLREKGLGMILILFSLPSAIPVPAPGYSTPFGVVLLLLGLQMLAGRDQLWIPKRTRGRVLPQKRFEPIFRHGSRWTRQLEGWVRPRLLIMSQPIGKVVLGGFVVAMGSLMILPIPLTNTLPAMVVFVIGVGLCEEDGLVLIAATALAFVSTLVYILVVYLALTIGITGLSDLLEWLRGTAV